MTGFMETAGHLQHVVSATQVCSTCTVCVHFITKCVGGGGEEGEVPGKTRRQCQDV